jgi:hypothetical protein
LIECDGEFYEVFIASGARELFSGIRWKFEERKLNEIVEDEEMERLSLTSND